MFTGIIEHQGVVKKKTAARLHIESTVGLVGQLALGESIAVNGVCLTVSKIPVKRAFVADVMPETLRRTTLGSLKPNSPVNLELPLKVGGRFGGHIVQGHVDGIGTIQKIKQEEHSRVLAIGVPHKIARYLVEKGSVAVNGVALTVIDSGARGFTVGIIPHTWAHTTFRGVSVGDAVNVEVDIIAKYVSKCTPVYEK